MLMKFCFADQPHNCQDLPCCAGCWEPRVQEEVGQDGGDQPAADCCWGERWHSCGEEPKEDPTYCRIGFRDFGCISHASCWVWICWFCWVWTTTCLLIVIFCTSIISLPFMFSLALLSANVWKWGNIDMKRIIPCTSCNDITIYFSASTQSYLFSYHDWILLLNLFFWSAKFRVHPFSFLGSIWTCPSFHVIEVWAYMFLYLLLALSYSLESHLYVRILSEALWENWEVSNNGG